MVFKMKPKNKTGAAKNDARQVSCICQDICLEKEKWCFENEKRNRGD